MQTYGYLKVCYIIMGLGESLWGVGLMVTRGPLVLTDPLLYQVHRAAHHGSQGLPFRGCEWGEIQLALGGLILGHNCYLSSPFAPENSLHSWLSPHLKIGVV